jgi:hypothetical protein
VKYGANYGAASGCRQTRLQTLAAPGLAVRHRDPGAVRQGRKMRAGDASASKKQHDSQ